MFPPPPRSPLFPYTTLFRSTFSHFSISDLTKAPNSPGPPAIGVEPSSASCDLIFAEASPALNSRLSLPTMSAGVRSEEHTSELQSLRHLVCRLLLEKKNIGLAEQQLAKDPEKAQQHLAEAREAAGAALQELRDLASGIHPPMLADRGLDAAIRALTT